MQNVKNMNLETLQRMVSTENAWNACMCEANKAVGEDVSDDLLEKWGA